MATTISFDPITKIISITSPPVAGVITLDVQKELYSEAKRQWLADPYLNKFNFPMRTIGGDAITPTQNAGTTFFLLDGWRIKPYEAGHYFQVDGNLYTDPAGFSPFIDTVGNYTVRIETRVSNLVDSSVSRLDLTQLQGAIYVDIFNGTPGTGDDNGTPTNPVDNIADARIIADAKRLKEIRFHGPITLDQAYDNFSFHGSTAEGADIVDINGQSVIGSRFDDCIVTGVSNGRIEAVNCGLQDISDWEGVAKNSGFKGTIELAAASSSVFHECYSEVSGGAIPYLDMDLGNSPVESVALRAYSGGLRVFNLNDPTEKVSIDLVAGRVYIDPSCTEGTIVVQGAGTLDNQGGPNLNVVTDALVDSSFVERLLDLAEADEHISGTVYRKLHKISKAILVQKTVNPPQTTPTIDLQEP